MDATLQSLRDCHLSWNRELTTYEANQHFIDSLRKYPDPDLYKDMIGRLIRYTKQKYFKTTKRLEKEKTLSKRTQTFTTHTTKDLREYKRFKENDKIGENYDYLNASKVGSSPWSADLDARYLCDIKRFIKKRLRRMCDETFSGCDNLRHRYQEHIKLHHCSGQVIREVSKENLSCNSCQRSKDSICKENDNKLLTRQGAEDDKLQKEIIEWSLRLPIYLDDSPEDRLKREEMICILVDELKKIKEDDGNFNHRAKDEIKLFLEEYPMWKPDDSNQKKIFRDYLVNDLLKKICQESDQRKKYHSEDNIIRMLEEITGIGSNIDREEILKEILGQLKSAAQVTGQNNERFKEKLKEDAMDILKTIAEEKNFCPTDDEINNLAGKISDYLTNLKSQHSKCSQNDDPEECIEKRLERKEKLLNNVSTQSHDIIIAASRDSKNDLPVKNLENVEKINEDSQISNNKQSFKALSQSYLTILADDNYSLAQTANITQEKIIPLRKNSIKFSHKRWVIQHRKHRHRRDSRHSLEINNTDYIEDQAIRGSENTQDETNEVPKLSSNSFQFQAEYESGRSKTMLENITDENKIAFDENSKNVIRDFSSNKSRNNDIAIDDETVQGSKEEQFALNTYLALNKEFMKKFKDILPNNQGNDLDLIKLYILKNLFNVAGPNVKLLVNKVDNLIHELQDLNDISQNKISDNDFAENAVEISPISDENENHFISNVKFNVRQTQSTLTKDDLDVLKRIRERSSFLSNQTIMDEVFNTIPRKFEDVPTEYKDNNVTFNEPRQLSEKAIQLETENVGIDQTENPDMEIGESRLVNLDESKNKEQDNVDNTVINEADNINNFPHCEHCEFCRSKYPAAARRRCREMKRKHSSGIGQTKLCKNCDDFYIMCPECGVKCPYPSRFYFHD